MSDTRAVDVRVTGQVQGVSFRAHAAREAVRLEVAGWIRNEPDGAVAAHIEGPDDAVGAMVAWLHDGSPGARVEAVDVDDVDVAGDNSFDVRY